jgi:opacity protein-like surface antigen
MPLPLQDRSDPGVCYLFGLKDDVAVFLFPFRRRSVGKLMVIRRSLSFLFLLFLIAGLGNRGMAQTLKNIEGAVSVFGQFSPTTNGNDIKDSPSTSMGVLATARQSLHPWLGYELNYSYTRFSERYSTIPFGVQNNVHEVSGAYLVQGPTIPILGLQPFGAVGVGALIFLPTSVGGQKYGKQTRVPVLFEVGVNYPIITSHLGLRLQYRGLSYKTPDFNTTLLTTGTRRITSEPSVGAYVRF